MRASVHPIHSGSITLAIAVLLALAIPSYAATPDASGARMPSSAIPQVIQNNSPQTPATAADTEDIRDIRPPIHLPPGWLWMVWVASGVALAALGYGLWRWRHRLPGLRLKLPYELALEKLEATRSLMQPATAREFSFAVSEIVRSYVEQHFTARAIHRTSDEFLRDCVSRSDSPLANHRQSLGEFLRHCDLAKFARWILAEDEMEAMLQSACSFVRETGQAASTSNQSPARSSRDRTTPPHTEESRTGAPAATFNAFSPTPGATNPTT